VAKESLLGLAGILKKPHAVAKDDAAKVPLETEAGLRAAVRTASCATEGLRVTKLDLVGPSRPRACLHFGHRVQVRKLCSTLTAKGDRTGAELIARQFLAEVEQVSPAALLPRLTPSAPGVWVSPHRHSCGLFEPRGKSPASS
jgi:hypothetical protein